MKLQAPSISERSLPVDPSEDVGDFESLVMYSCELLSETDCRFLVSGFGQKEWPVSIEYDLSTVLEQLPDLISGIRAGEVSELDFYAQGTQRILDFIPGAERLEIKCRSGTLWVPDPEVEFIDEVDAESMLVQLAVDFSVTLRRFVPNLAELPPFPEWASRSL
jgi:hypothetical protein